MVLLDTAWWRLALVSAVSCIGCGPTNPTLPDASSDASCTEGAACDLDGDGCTQEVCTDGVCVARGPVDCDDGDSCTIDTCVTTSSTMFECRNEDSMRSCIIAGECVADGASNPRNTCEVCDVSEADRAWSISSAPCDDGDECTVDDTCESGVCAGTPRVDEFEPNDTLEQAVRLGEVEDSTDFPQGNLNGILFPETDEDFFVYADLDRFRGVLRPQVELLDIPSGANYELCGFIQCREGETNDVACALGTSARFEGNQGCCSDNPGNADERIRFSLGCAGTDDSVDVFVRVRDAGGEVGCTEEYTLRYGDN